MDFDLDKEPSLFSNAEVAELVASYRDLKTENQALKQRAEASADSNRSGIKINLPSGHEDQDHSKTESLSLEELDTLVNQRAIELMAKVGQPAPLNAGVNNDLLGGGHTNSKATGLTLTAQYFRERAAGGKN